MPQFDTIVKGGTVVDGTKVPRYQPDIGIKDGKIAEIGKLNDSDVLHNRQLARRDHRHHRKLRLRVRSAASARR